MLFDNIYNKYKCVHCHKVCGAGGAGLAGEARERKKAREARRETRAFCVVAGASRGLPPFRTLTILRCTCCLLRPLQTPDHRTGERGTPTPPWWGPPHAASPRPSEQLCPDARVQLAHLSGAPDLPCLATLDHGVDEQSCDARDGGRGGVFDTGWGRGSGAGARGTCAGPIGMPVANAISLVSTNLRTSSSRCAGAHASGASESLWCPPGGHGHGWGRAGQGRAGQGRVGRCKGRAAR